MTHKPGTRAPGDGDKPASTPDRHGEAILRAALLRSLRVILVLVLLVAALLWWVNRDAGAPAPVVDAEVPIPETEPAYAGRDPPAVPFKDITREAGVDFVHVNGAQGNRLMPEPSAAAAASSITMATVIPTCC